MTFSEHKAGCEAAIILAGGRGSRLGGLRKADLVVGGQRLLQTVLDAVAGCSQRVVVGYEDLHVPAGVEITREGPPGSGPAAAVAAGMELIETSGWVLTLACDLPGAQGAVPALLEAAAKVGPGVDSISASSGERLEWLISIHRADSLRRAIGRFGGNVANLSMRRLYEHMAWERVYVPPASTQDIDTWEDHEQWQQRANKQT